VLKRVVPVLYSHLINLRGWRTNRKIIVFESDDWGSIRMPNKSTYQRFLKAGYPVDKIAYEKFDTLASVEDLEALYDVLASFKDINGNYPVITANTIVANPDFERIKKSYFEEYHFESFTKTLERYGPKYDGVFQLWKEGIDSKVFYPQYHGREHLNVSKFMSSLRNGNKDTIFAFENQMPGCIPKTLPVSGNQFIEATRYVGARDKAEKLKFFLEGYQMFEEIFGYKSKTVIPTNYQWSSDWDEAAAKAGVEAFQGLRMRKSIETGKRGVVADSYENLYLGKKNAFGQIFLVRNCVFEPSLFKLNIKDPVGYCFNQIEAAFRMKKPAVITSHRLNFIGELDLSNRRVNLYMLEILLKKILKNWPDVEFITSDQLLQLISEN
jgi:hypothetical protein